MRLCMTLLISFLTLIASANQGVQTVTGEHLKNMSIAVRNNASYVIPKDERDAANLAMSKCLEQGYTYRLAFYYELKDSKIILTDAFCSNENVNATYARAAIMKDREKRGAILAPPAPSILKQYKNVLIKGFKVMDFNNVSETSKELAPKEKKSADAAK